MVLHDLIDRVSNTLRDPFAVIGLNGGLQPRRHVGVHSPARAGRKSGSASPSGGNCAQAQGNRPKTRPRTRSRASKCRIASMMAAASESARRGVHRVGASEGSNMERVSNMLKRELRPTLASTDAV